MWKFLKFWIVFCNTIKIVPNVSPWTSNGSASPNHLELAGTGVNGFIPCNEHLFQESWKKVGNMTSSFYELPGSPVSMLSNYSGSQTGRCTWMLTPHLPQMCRMRWCESIQSATLSKNHWVSPHPGTLGPHEKRGFVYLVLGCSPFPEPGTVPGREKLFSTYLLREGKVSGLYRIL